MIDKRFKRDDDYNSCDRAGEICSIRVKVRGRRFYLGCGSSLSFPNCYVWRLDVHDNNLYDEYSFLTYFEAEKWIREYGYL